MSVTKEACNILNCLLVHPPFPQVVKQACVGNVVKGARDVKQQEASYLANLIVLCFVDLLSNGVECVFSKPHLSAAYVC